VGKYLQNCHKIYQNGHENIPTYSIPRPPKILKSIQTTLWQSCM
jgi:hypothetical protein